MAQNTLAFLFPGQGSQTVGMLLSVYEEHAVVRDTFAEAADALGEDLWALIQAGPQEALNMTATTQPVLLSCSVALWRAWQAAGGAAPAIMAGHSLGEFSALVCAEVFSFADAVQLVRKRGEFMQSAVPAGQGAMAAIIGLDDDAINAVCADVAASGVGVVAAVNYNSPGQVVIAGHAAAVDAANVALKQAGAKRAMPLPVSAPFHTALMEPAGEQLAGAIAGVAMSAPQIPIVHNVHARTEADPEKIRALLIEQIHPAGVVDPVYAGNDKCRCELVCRVWARKSAQRLNRRIDKSLNSYNIDAADTLQGAVTEFNGSAGESS